MQDASFADDAGTLRRSAMSPGVRVAMLLLGYVPLLHVLLTIGTVFLPLALPLRVACALAVLYLAPPLVSRLAPLREGTFSASDGEFLRWWFVNQLQVLFNRLPLEEIVRIVPGLYSVWLRLWGAKIGTLVYWSPRVLLLDRGLLDIGDRVVLGAGVRLSGHALTRTEKGDLQLIVGTVTIGDEAVVGGWAVIAPGASVAAGESVPATVGIAPHTTWSGGRRRRGGNDAL